MKQPEDAHKYGYFILIAEDGSYWNGKEWVWEHHQSRHYLNWTAARSAQYHLKRNHVFKSKLSKIEGRGKKMKYWQIGIPGVREDEEHRSR